MFGKASELELSKLHPSIREHVEKLFHKKWYDRLAAAEALGEEKRVEAIPFLERALKKESFEDNRMKIVEALGKTRHADVIPTLEDILKNEEYLKVWLSAAKALEEVGGKLPRQKPGDKHYLLQKTLKLIKPSEHPTAFFKLYQAFKDGTARKMKKQTLAIYAKQLKQQEGHLKADAA